MEAIEMRRSTITIVVGTGLFVAASTGLASAHEKPWQPSEKRQEEREKTPGTAAGMVFVNSNDLEANSVLAFRRAADGTLTKAGTFPTGGRGGAQEDNPFDPLASQDSMVFDRKHRMLMVVNAGSNSVTTFRVRGDRLTDRHVTPSGGQFPTSIAVSGNLAYVLNAGGETNVSGFRIKGGGLKPLAESTRELGITNDAVPLFTASPPQVGFSPDGDQVLVTTKSANTIETFSVGGDGRLAADPVSTKSEGDVPFSFVFDRAGHLLVTEAAESGVTSYDLKDDGSLTPISRSVVSGQKVLCWIVRAGNFFYGTNPGSSTVSLYSVDGKGTVTLGGRDGVIAQAGGERAADEVAAADPEAAGAKAPGAGPIDMAVTPDGKQLFVQNTLFGTVETYQVGAGGALTLTSTLAAGLPVFADGAGMEGIVAI
jgi:6-phosphogluconolactonase (cycloisomerase 2 family)